jgi:hypothetical protein
VLVARHTWEFVVMSCLVWHLMITPPEDAGTGSLAQDQRLSGEAFRAPGAC